MTKRSLSIYTLFGRWSRRYSWHLIIAMLVIAILLIIAGLLLLLVGKSKEQEILFKIAKFLGASGAALASIKAFWKQIREKYDLIRLQQISDHVVLCGLGDKGMHLLTIFTGKKDGEINSKLVVIEAQKDHPDIAGCKERKALVIAGDASDSVVLDEVNIARAKYLFAVTGDDISNIKIAHEGKHLAENVYNEGEKVFLRCYVHVAESSLRDAFARHELFAKAYDYFDASIFNIYETASRVMLEKYPPDFYASKRDLRGNSIPIVVVGFGKMGQNLVKQAARIGHYTLWPMLDISVVGPNIKEGADKFLAIYGDSQTPRSFVVPDVNINFIDCDPECISSLADITGTANQNKKPVAVYIALDNDSLAVSLAFQIRSILDSNDIPIIVCMHSSLADLMEGKKTQFILNHNIHAFNILNAACGYQSLMENVTDALARSIHEIYLASQKEVAAFMRWENLDEIMKDANRWSADHLSTKLRTIGFDGQDLSIFDKIKNDETFIEKLSEMEHRRWMAERFMDGWRFGDKRNNKKKIHNLLVPYNQLSDQEKSKDTDMINNMKKLVTSSGWEIHNKFFKNADL